MKSKTVIGIISLLLILLFTYTAASKLIEHDRFLFQLRLSPLPQIVGSALFLSWTVPLIEIIVTIILVIGIFIPGVLKWGLWTSLVLFMLFEIYITAMLFSGKKLPCACGGIISLMSWKGHELFNGVAIILIAVVLFVIKKYTSMNTANERDSRV
jgi:putative oxidoreductase